MNQDELVAKKYLEEHYDNVIYEPDGNISPDFSVGNSIGVEVRRLNQQYYNDNEDAEGLEEAGISLKRKVEEVLSKYSADPAGNNFWLTLRYERNVGKLKDIKKNTVLAVCAFQSQNENIPFKYELSNNVFLEFLVRGSKELNSKYKIGIDSDKNRGGWVKDIYTQAINHSIYEKEEKIKPRMAEYNSWWLLLVDHINSMDSYDKEGIVQNIIKPPCFERIIVVNYDGTSQLIDL